MLKLKLVERMASPESADGDSLFSQVEQSLASVIDSPIGLFTDRKKQLSAEISRARADYEEKQTEGRRGIEELIASRDELECIASLMKENRAQGELKKSIANLELRIAALEQELPALPKIEFKFDANQLKQIQDLILSFGRIEMAGTAGNSAVQEVKSEPTPADTLVSETPDKPARDPIQLTKCRIAAKPRDYTLIKSHQTKIAKFGKEPNELLDPGYIYIDELRERVFICDGGNGRVQVWTTEGEYLSEFGKGQLVSPVGIVFCQGSVFITDFYKKCVFKFDSDFKYVKKFRRKQEYELNYTHGIDTDGQELFVAEPFKHKISVFSPNLDFQRTLGVKIIKKCYSIRVREEVLTALEYNTNTIKQLETKSGALIRTIALNKDSIALFNCTFLSVDLYGNFLVTDMVADLLKIVNQEGDLISVVNFTHWKCHEPRAVALTSDGRMFIGFSEGENSILLV